MQVVLEGHIVAAAMEYFGIESPDDQPSTAIEILKKEGDKQAKFQEMVLDMVRKSVNLPTWPTAVKPRKNSLKDGVNAYAQEVLTLTLVWAQFEDAIREGDGLQVIRCWRFMLLIFKAANRTNYSKEAITLLVQYQALLSPRQREQLVWSRFVNTKGKPGANKPCDLHTEHLNRTVKAALGTQSSNLKPSAINRIGRCAGPLDAVCQQFDSVSSVWKPSGKHCRASWKEDVIKIATKLREVQVFQEKASHKHDKFPSVTGSLISRLDFKGFEGWVKKWLTELSMQQL